MSAKIFSEGVDAAYSKKGPIQQSKGKISHFLIATLKINFWSIVNHQREHKH